METETINAQIRGSYQDTLWILRHTDGWNMQMIKQLLDLEYHNGRSRLLGLLRLDPIPKIDFLNTAKKQWVHPMDDQLTFNESFPELFEKGISDASCILREVVTAHTAKEIGAIVGNEDLATGFPWTKTPMRNSDPLPLGALYTRAEVKAVLGESSKI